jgi:hypothetical protein
MRLSAELRWFWSGEPANEFNRWFVEAGQTWHAARPPKTRLDDYLVDPRQSTLSIKRRSSGSIIEIKGLITARNQTLSFANCTAYIELWAKWPISALDLSCTRVVTIEKQRRMRSFRAKSAGVHSAGVHEVTPTSEELGTDAASGCNVELTRISGPDRSSWWTCGFEAFGALEEIEGLLAATLAEMNRRTPPPPMRGQACSYAAWLSKQQW